MKLVQLRTVDGELWINPEHVTSIVPQRFRLEGGAVRLQATIKLEGLPLITLQLGEHPSAAAADAAWAQLVNVLTGSPDAPRAPAGVDR